MFIKIPVEILFPGIIIVMIIVWALWNTWSKRRLLKKYNDGKEKNKTPKGEPGLPANFKVAKPPTRERATEGSTESSGRSKKSGGRQLLQATDTNTVGKDKPGNRKKHRSFRELLKRGRRNRRRS